MGKNALYRMIFVIFRVLSVFGQSEYDVKETGGRYENSVTFHLPECEEVRVAFRVPIAYRNFNWTLQLNGRDDSKQTSFCRNPNGEYWTPQTDSPKQWFFIHIWTTLIRVDGCESKQIVTALRTLRGRTLTVSSKERMHWQLLPPVGCDSQLQLSIIAALVGFSFFLLMTVILIGLFCFKKRYEAGGSATSNGKSRSIPTDNQAEEGRNRHTYADPEEFNLGCENQIYDDIREFARKDENHDYADPEEISQGSGVQIYDDIREFTRKNEDHVYADPEEFRLAQKMPISRNHM